MTPRDPNTSSPQGHDSALRAARMSGAVGLPEPEPADHSPGSDALLYWCAVVCSTLISVAAICGGAGYLWGTYQPSIERAYAAVLDVAMALATRWF